MDLVSLNMRTAQSMRVFTDLLLFLFVSSALYTDRNEVVGQKSAFSVPSFRDLGHHWWTGLLLY